MSGIDATARPPADTAAAEAFLRSDPISSPRPIERTGFPKLAAASGQPALALSLHSDLADLTAEWQAFEREADCTVFQTYGWLANWQACIGVLRGTRPAIVAGRDAGGQLLFICQLAVENRGPARCLTWLASDLCDYNAPLLARRFADSPSARDFGALWRSIVTLIEADPHLRFDYIDLERMPPTVGAQPNPFLALPVANHPSGAHIATLAGDWETFYAAKRSASTRKTERKQVKQLAGVGDIHFVELDDRAGITETLDTLFEQKARSFARMGVANMFDRPGYRAFYQAVATDPAMRDIVHVTRLDVGSTAAATNVGLRFGGRYYLILSSYQDGELSRYGTGRLHLRELMRNAIERGFRLFDFTVGDEAYKRDWCDIELRLYDLLAAETLLGRAVVATIASYRHTKRFIKQTPVLWHIFSRARGLAGALKRRANP